MVLPGLSSAKRQGCFCRSRLRRKVRGAAPSCGGGTNRPSLGRGRSRYAVLRNRGGQRASRRGGRTQLGRWHW